MHRGYWMSALLLMALLAACQQGTPTIRWLSPSAGGTVSGKVRLSAEPLAEPAPPNVVFSLGNKEIAKAYLVGDGYEAVFDTSSVEPGDYTLRAVPYGAQSLPLEISVARNVPSGADTTTGTPETPTDADPALGSDPLNLVGLLDLWRSVGRGRATEVARYAPGDFPWASLWRGSAVQASVQGLFTQQIGVLELPRGSYRYNEKRGAWEGLRADAGSLSVSFSYPDPKTLQTHEVVIMVNWEDAGETQVVASQLGEIEAPTATRVYVTDNGETILDMDVTAAWHKPDGCPQAILEPETLSLTGYTSHARPEEGDATPAQDEGDAAPERREIDASNLELNWTLGTDPIKGEDTLELTLGLVTLAGDAQADLNLVVAATGEIARVDCFASGGSFVSLSLDTEIGIGLVDGPRRGSHFSLAASEPGYNSDGLPVSAELEGEITTFDEASLAEDVTRYSGRLDETNGDGFPGENVTVVEPGGETTTLDRYAKMIFELYRAMIEEKITDTR